MSKQDMVEIAFPYGGIIPAKVLGAPKDVKLAPHTPHKVPKDYAEHLIADLIAYDYKARQKQQEIAKEQKNATVQIAKEQADKQVEIDKLQAALAEVTDERNKSADDLVTAYAELGELKAQISTLENELEASKDANMLLEASLKEAMAVTTKQGDLQIGNESEKAK